MNTTRRSLAALTASILFAAPCSLAQSTEQPLKGPEVTDRPSTGGGKGKSKSSFSGEPAGKNKARANAPVPMTAFLKAVKSANLTDDQSSKVAALAAEFDASVAKFKEAHKADIEAARANLSEQDRAAFDKMLESGRPIKTGKAGFQGKRKSLGKGKPGQTDADSESMTDSSQSQTGKQSAEARAKLVEIYSQRPAPGETQTKILALLNEKQAAAVETELKKFGEARREGGKGKAPRGKDAAPGKPEGAGKS
ncbi:MAG: hypothetical protein IT438_16845 [Phycisphaerales bacterium]|nr:hypothetical protein [Phycisphaerales bacterium]